MHLSLSIYVKVPCQLLTQPSPKQVHATYGSSEMLCSVGPAFTPSQAEDFTGDEHVQVGVCNQWHSFPQPSHMYVGHD